MNRDRKPKTKPSSSRPTNGEREPAFDLVNEFMRKKGIIIQLSKPEVSYTNQSDILIKAPTVGAVYKDQLQMPK